MKNSELQKMLASFPADAEVSIKNMSGFTDIYDVKLVGPSEMPVVFLFSYPRYADIFQKSIPVAPKSIRE